MKILLIRHSKTIVDKTKSSLLWKLSDEGIVLAEKLSKNIQIKNCQKIYSSLQTKALETALILAKDNYIPIATNPDLTETTSVTNGYFENYEDHVSKWHQGNYRILNGETKEESLARFNNAINTIVNKEPTLEIIGIVAHSNILAVFSEQFLHIPSIKIDHSISMPDISLFDTETKQFILTWGTSND